MTEAPSYASITKLDRRRAVTVSADVVESVANAEQVMREFAPDLDSILGAHPSVDIIARGRQKDFADSFRTLPIGMLAACGLIYVVLTWLFQSYTQPLVVLMAVPFSFIGMVWGHFFLGFDLTFLSLIGFIALAGVVVNDSLIYIEFFNHQRAQGHPVDRAAIEAGIARIRPILLTTITTVLGLTPLMLEQSFQARFLIPMAITISGGLISATVIILIVLPCILVMGQDIRTALLWFWHAGEIPEPEPESSMNPAPTRDIRAVIFDVDGVLVDSYDAHLQSWSQLAQRTGITFNEHHFADTFGRTSADILRAFWAESTLLTPSKIRELDDEKESLYRDIISRSFPAMPGAAECVRDIHAVGIKIALGSSGPPANVHLVSDKLGIADMLDAVVTGRDVTTGKPDPEVFLIAAQRLGIAPMHCAVVEDAPAGIEAAIAANMMAIGFPSKGRTRAELSNAGAQTTAPRLTDIARLIEA